MDVLGRFIHECINWLEHAENDEREGLTSDDRFAKGVQNVRDSPSSSHVRETEPKPGCSYAGFIIH